MTYNRGNTVDIESIKQMTYAKGNAADMESVLVSRQNSGCYADDV